MNNKLKISDYYYELTYQVDEKVELYIQSVFNNEGLVSDVNKQRQQCLAVISECQSLNMARLNDRERTEPRGQFYSEEELFVPFCFLAVFPNNLSSYESETKFAGQGLKLCVVERYLNPEQINCFQALLTYIQDNRFRWHRSKALNSSAQLFFDCSFPNEFDRDFKIEFANDSPSPFIIRDSSTRLCGLRKVTLDNMHVHSIRECAKFLFACCSELTIIFRNQINLNDLKNTIDEFEAIRSSNEKLKLKAEFYNILYVPPSVELTKYHFVSLLFKYDYKDGYEPFIASFLKCVDGGMVRELTINDIVWREVSIKDQVLRLVPNVEKIDLGSCSLPKLKTRLLFSNTPHVTDLNLSHTMPLKTINSGLFIHLPALRVLQMSNCRIKHIHKEALNKLVRLSRLDVSCNELESFETSAPVKHFNASFNRLTSVRLICNDENQLEYVNLDMNSLSLTNFSEMFANKKTQKKLKRFDIAMNLINKIDIGAFVNMPCLTYLSIENNDVKFIDTNAFCVLSGLQQLRLSINSLETLWHSEENLFRAFRKTLFSLHLTSFKKKQLNIQREVTEICSTRFSKLPPGLLYDYEQLMELKIIGFQDLRSISLECVRSLPNIKYMCLDSNNIETIEPLFLCSFPSLKAISLFNNQIDKCPSTSELGKSLEAVNLSMNAIRSLDGAFSSLKNMNSTLREIILSNNKLVHIEINAFASLKALNSLELNNCQTERLEPGCFQGIVKLERLDLSNNSFTSIDSGLFVELINLKVIKLSECKNLSNIDPEAFPEFNQQVRVQITTGKELLSELAIRNVLIGI